MWKFADVGILIDRAQRESRACVVFLSFVLFSCSSYPAPEMPLSATSATARPARPSRPDATPPTFPSVGALALPGARVWFVERPGERLWLRLESRRGLNDSPSRWLLPLTVRAMCKKLDELLPNARVECGWRSTGAHLGVEIAPAQFEEALDMLLRALTEDPTEGELDDAKQWLRDDLRRRSDLIFHRAKRIAREAMNQLSPEYAVASDVEIARMGHIPLEQVIACRRERFARMDLALIIAGPLSSSDVARETASRLGGTYEDSPRPAIPQQPARPRRVAFSYPANLPLAHVYLFGEAPPDSSEDRLVFELFLRLMGGSYSSAINQGLRVEHGYTYGSSSFVDDSEAREIMVVGSAIDPVSVRPALEALFQGLRDATSSRVSSQDIARVRAQLWTELRRRLEGRGLMEELALAWRAHLTPRQLEARYRELQDLDGASLLAAVRRNFHPGRAIMFITGDFNRVGGVEIVRDGTGFHLGD